MFHMKKFVALLLAALLLFTATFAVAETAESSFADLLTAADCSFQYEP